MSYQDRLSNVIPGGSHTYSRGSDQFPANAPSILEKGKDAYVWDPDGKKYLDYGMGLRAVTLGYANSRVNAAAWREIERGNNLTRPSTIELEAAELMVDLIPSADMVKFAKNGSNVTTGAAKIARAYTGRKYICIPRQHPFFSFDDWFIGKTPIERGIPAEHASFTLQFDYGDIDSLKSLFLKYPGEIAGVMLEPATTITPCSKDCKKELFYLSPCSGCPDGKINFLQSTQNLCKENGALFILDEMITGFRWQLDGAQSYFGVTPDLSTFGKGMANGFSVAALVGRRDIMDVASIDKIGNERTFLLSSTHGGEMASLGAFVETVKIYKEQEVCKHLWFYGKQMQEGFNSLIADAGLEDHFKLDGPAINMNYMTLDKDLKPSLEFRTLFQQEMLRYGVMIPWIAPSLAHGDIELQLTLEAAHKAFNVYKSALQDGAQRFLEGSSIKPVFRKYN